MAIVAVFCAGLVKLWWNNRLMEKQEVLDEEKRARVEEMRKTGLPIKRTSDVPFGVRAIQSGVEVPGIWISRSLSPNGAAGAKLASSSTLAGRDADSQKKAGGYPEDEKSGLVTTVSLDRGSARQSPSNGSIFQKLTDSDSVESAQSVAAPVSQFACKAKRQSSRPIGVLNEDTLRRLEGQGPPKPLYDTYVPTPSRRKPRQPSQRSSASSSGESVASQPHSVRSASGKSYTSSRSSRLYLHRNSHGPRTGHDPALRRWSEKEGPDPFGTPARTLSGFSAFSHQTETHGSLSQSQDMSAPEPTFGPGDLRFNKTSRRVNDGFEVLPAGTFGTPGEVGATGEPGQKRQRLEAR